MKERPILFNAAMVRAILDGNKTQTRRVAKLTSSAHVKEVGGHRRWHPADSEATLACPYGQVGDRLWVREAFRLVKTLPGGAAGDSVPPSMVLDSTRKFEADGATSLPDRVFGKLCPGIHMPRWFSRITLEITGVRVQRLNEISEEDARAEGITDGGCLNCGNSETDCECLNPRPDARDSFIHLWQSINGEGSWLSNPWVWVVEFKRLEGSAA